MWPDNETDVDLLGFDFLVDELLELLKEPKLLPVTIGIAGDLGSGKSSVPSATFGPPGAGGWLSTRHALSHLLVRRQISK